MTLDQLVAGLPRAALRTIIERKIDAAGAPRTEGLVSALVEHVLARSTEVFTHDCEEQGSYSLSFTSDDAAELKASVANVIAQLPDIIADAAVAGAKPIFRTLRKRWPQQAAEELDDLTVFRRRIHQRWGNALGYLQMMLTVSRELGAEQALRFSKSRAKKDRLKRQVLLQLHARSCQVSDEVLVLLSNGFANGAMARWRTLHEIATVSLLIEQNDDELSQRYVAHEVIEAKRAADTYMKTCSALGFPPLTTKEMRKIESAASKAVAKFGSDFKNEYGWASTAVGNPNPKFVHLEAAAGRGLLRSHYRLASYNVHAGIHGITRSLESLQYGAVQVAGPSNAGLEEPGQATLATLAQATATILGLKWSIDELITWEVMSEIRAQGTLAFAKASRKLVRDERVASRSRVK